MIPKRRAWRAATRFAARVLFSTCMYLATGYCLAALWISAAEESRTEYLQHQANHPRA